MDKGGRPTKLTNEVQRIIVDLVRRGNYLDTAAMHAGVERSTLRKWMQRGRSSKSGLYRRFFLAVNKAAAFPEVSDMEVIRKAASSDWRAAAWRLEHRYPQRYAKKTTKHEVTGTRGGPVQTDKTVIILPDNGRLPE